MIDHVGADGALAAPTPFPRVTCDQRSPTSSWRSATRSVLTAIPPSLSLPEGTIDQKAATTFDGERVIHLLASVLV